MSSVSRAQLKLFVPLGIGLLVALALLFALFGMVRSERADALWSVERHRRLAVQYGKRELIANLHNRLARSNTAMLAARADPLVACPGCLWRQSGRQLLPRLAARAPDIVRDENRHGDDSVQFWHQALVAGRDEGDAMWAERIALQQGCGERDGVARLAVFHADYVLPVEQELASALASLAGCAHSGAARAEIIRGAAALPGRRRVEGIQQRLLRVARDLTPDDAAWVHAHILRASEQAGIGADEFRLRYAELAEKEVVIPEGLTGPALITDRGGHYYVQPAGEELVGVSVDLSAELAAVAWTMRESGLIDADDELRAKVPAAGQDLPALGIALRSPRTARARADIHDRYGIKLFLLGLFGALAFVMVGMGVLLQRRRMRILELKSHFVAGVSHEFKTPLASMRVLAETLDRRTRGMAEVRDYPQRLLRDIDGMVFLVENILSFNRLTKGRMVPRREVMSIRELVARAVDEVREHTGKDIEVEVEVDVEPGVEPGDASMTGDPELLSLLFRNLAANSVAYNRRTPVTIKVGVAIGARQRKVISFADNGVGIAPDDRSAIFDDFYRGQSSAMARGSGLGLALCKRIVELHRATIAVDRTGPEGTVFVMVFP